MPNIFHRAKQLHSVQSVDVQGDDEMRSRRVVAIPFRQQCHLASIAFGQNLIRLWHPTAVPHKQTVQMLALVSHVTHSAVQKSSWVVRIGAGSRHESAVGQLVSAQQGVEVAQQTQGPWATHGVPVELQWGNEDNANILLCLAMERRVDARGVNG